MHEKLMIFNNRKTDALAGLRSMQSKHKAVSWYRVLVFVSFVPLIIWLIRTEYYGFAAGATAAFLFLFGLLINHHNSIKRKRDFFRQLAEVNEAEIKRLKYDFEGIDEGTEFMNENHDYAWDLDIFGRNSLFQLINRTGSRAGRQMLSRWMLTSATKDIIKSRQQAVQELMPMVEWRQRLQVSGQAGKKINDNEENLFYNWLGGKDLIRANRLYRIMPWVMLPLSIAMIIGTFSGLLSIYFLLAPFAVSGWFLMKISPYARVTYGMTLSGIHTLSAIENSLKLIEGRQFKSNSLAALREKLFDGTRPPSQNIMSLRKIFEWLNMRHNQLYMIFNGLFLLDLFWFLRAERWRAQYKIAVSSWFETLAEIESLSSIAAYAYAHDEQYTFPEITEKSYIFHGRALGHPLIPDDKRVCNDFSIEGRGATCIITGSNMAGKSTFLRTVGINSVLALMGAPVCASDLKLSVYKVFTSMRTKDNLEENISSFYAELLRLKMLLDEVEHGEPVFYLLDEILKGTNSHDRHTGAEALIRQLKDSNAFGLVSTHDLELGKMAENHDLITNFHFDSKIDEEEIIFDYKLRPGICRNTNASRLMAKMGIRLSDQSKIN